MLHISCRQFRKRITLKQEVAPEIAALEEMAATMSILLEACYKFHMPYQSVLIKARPAQLGSMMSRKHLARLNTPMAQRALAHDALGRSGLPPLVSQPWPDALSVSGLHMVDTMEYT